MSRGCALVTYVHETMGHRADDSDVTLLLEGKDVVMVLEENDGLTVELAGNLHGFRAVNEVRPFILQGSRVGVLEETHGEFGAEQSRDGSVNRLNIELSGLDQLWDLLEVAVGLSVPVVVGSRG